MAREVNQLKIGSLLSYVQMGLGAVVSLAFTPVMLRLLGRSEYGLYSTVTSAISMLSLLDLGFSSGYIRFYAQYREKGDRNGIARLNGFFLLLFSGLGLVALGCGLFLTGHAELVFSRGLTAEEYATARRLLRILSVNLSCMFPMRVFGNIISAKERFVFLRAVHLGRTVLSPLVMLPLLLMGYRSAAMVWVTLLFSLGTDLLFAWYVLRVLGEKFVFRGFERGAVRSLLLYTSFIAVNLIADQVNWNVDKVLLGRFRGTGEVAVYAVGYTLFQYYMMLSTSVSSVFTPRIHRIIRQTETDDRARRQALTELFGQPIEIDGSGRTDAGVHAAGQVASFHAPQRPIEAILPRLRHLLPEDIGAMALDYAPERFHARLNAKEKSYIYRVWNSAAPDVFERRFRTQVQQPLDVPAMERAAALLCGTHDFRSFCANKQFKKSSVRTLRRLEITQNGGELCFRLTADGFLHHMVRILVGTLLEIGQGKRAPEEIPAIFAAQRREAAGETAPAKGLCLQEVRYE